MTSNYQISSNYTLFYKMFLPTVWVSFFGVFAMVLFVFPMDNTFVFSNTFRIGFLLVFLIFLVLVYFTFLSLKRIEFNPDSWSVTNYLKTYQYQYSDIEKISITNIGIMKLASVHLKDKGSFGKRMPIILNQDVLDQFLRDFPEKLSVPIGSKNE